MPIELKVQEPFKVTEGRHSAAISKVEERKEPYHYIDVYFALDDQDVELKYGCPANVSEKSRLGRLLAEAGTKLEVDTMVNLEEALVGKRFTLMTIDEKSEKGVFARIVEGSITSL